MSLLFLYIKIQVNKNRYCRQPNNIMFWILYNMQQYKLQEAAAKDQPAPNKIHKAIFSELIFCTVDHAFNKLQALFWREIVLEVFHLKFYCSHRRSRDHKEE